MDYVIVTDWEKVDAADFYLTDKSWVKDIEPDTLAKAKELQSNGNLRIGYIVPAVSYAFFTVMCA